MKTTCSCCPNALEANRLGKNRYCLSCHNAHMRKTRKKHSELSPKQKLKANARAYLNVYLKRGKIIKSPCRECGSVSAEAHHPDHSKPLEIIWLCRTHHLKLEQSLST